MPMDDSSDNTGKPIKVDPKVIHEMVDAYLEQIGVNNVLESAKKMAEATVTAFTLIENDPHTWSDERPCQTCSAVSALIGRPFGCVRKQQQKKG